ncbi:hypothetical protein MOVS_05230 [Moraxella ovis]|uniref:Uncharacterized protein n=1 Tax=Moraxella ovis TaxID=29433 RepID=A0A378PQ98_9GAMM|nr:hypothetical protein [Moraxella ovis]ANB91481.1 hypothetical protein MOVS_05230 [Moraxella ovis]STY87099.1 Uncharacterised protein [Moraxella ovis]
MNPLYKTLNVKPISTSGLSGISTYPTTVTAAMPSVLESITTPNNFTYESGMVESTPYLNTGYDYGDISTGVSINNTVAKAYAKNPRLGAFTERATNLGNNILSGAMNTGRNMQSAVNGMDSFQKMNAIASSVKGLWDAYNGYKNNKMINRQLNFSMDMANKQYEANRKRINSQLEDRQARRYAEQPHAHQSVSEYMKKYGV